MAIDLDFSDVKPFEKISEADHVFLVSGAEVKPTKAGDSNNLVINCDVVGGEEDGKSLVLYLNLSPQSLWNAKLFFEAITGEEVNEISIEEDALMGQTFVGTVRHTADGKYANIVAYATND